MYNGTNESAGQVRAERLRELEEYSNISLELNRIKIRLDSEDCWTYESKANILHIVEKTYSRGCVTPDAHFRLD